MPPATDHKGWLPNPKHAVYLYNSAARCKIVSKFLPIFSTLPPSKEYWINYFCL